ncbi:hypothetical protein [Desulfurobacterium indicum]|uniref:Uncharacterized protein n=1 Tax=Desulfurobacterium indicum TaxID=1914305 RepID=A0A1R1MKX0_9BACT|nr:hypothetical protein [Desulfurobacterium indicum]OMH40455.1 hypothetical protein BLW93_05175 [Desulfurobacterium indicum]
MDRQVDVLIISSDKVNEELVDSLNENRDFISSVYVSGKEKEIYSDYDGKVEFLNFSSVNKAFLRNRLIEIATSPYVLYLSENSSLDDDTFEELFSSLEDRPDADIVYPNEVILWSDEETVRNFDEYAGREVELLQSLAIENLLPEYGSLIRTDFIKEKGGFDERFAEYEFYDFIYKNIKDLRLKWSEFAFVNYELTETFIDTSYRSLSVREVINIYDWKEDIFPLLRWDDENVALSTANTIIGDRLSFYVDFLNASEFYRRSLFCFHNTVSLGKLFDTYLLMGRFDDAFALLGEGFSPEEVNDGKERLSNVKKIVSELEKAVQDGKLEEVIAAMNDVADYYKGAPIHNIMGVIAYLTGDYEGAYRFFYKAVTMNPLEKDFLMNLTDMAKKLGKEDEVVGLIDRLVKQG